VIVGLARAAAQAPRSATRRPRSSPPRPLFAEPTRQLGEEQARVLAARNARGASSGSFSAGPDEPTRFAEMKDDATGETAPAAAENERTNLVNLPRAGRLAATSAAPPSHSGARLPPPPRRARDDDARAVDPRAMSLSEMDWDLD
jgi:hypothetical protein